MGSIMNGGMLCNNLLRVDDKRQKIPKKPDAYGMKFRDISFNSSEDNIPIKGWFIPGRPDKGIAIMTHPMPMSRYGFAYKQQGLFKVTKVEVELMKTAQQLNSKMGLNVIAFDFRNHGESGKANKGYASIGVYEYRDVIGCLDYIKQDDNLKDKPICFVSHCQGANATIIALSKNKEKFENVKCIFAVQPVSMNVLVPCMLDDKFKLFSGCYTHINKKSVEYQGVALEEMSPKEYVKDINLPICYTQVRNDPWTKNEDMQYFFDNTPEDTPKKLIWVEGEKINERFHGYNYFGDNPDQMIEFLNEYMGDEDEGKKKEEEEEEGEVEAEED